MQLNRVLSAFLAKFADIVVDSRSGNYVSTRCNPQASRSHWFNLALNDPPSDVAMETSSLLTQEPHLISQNFEFTVEISLRTCDEDVSLVLEHWTTRVRSDTARDTSVCADNTFIQQLGLLLKSVLVFTRTTHTIHRLCTCRSTQSHVVLYRLLLAEGDSNKLGPNVDRFPLGSVTTPQLNLNCDYSGRTELCVGSARIPTDPLLSSGDLQHSDPYHLDIFNSQSYATMSGCSPLSCVGYHHDDAKHACNRIKGVTTNTDTNWLVNGKVKYCRIGAFADEISSPDISDCEEELSFVKLLEPSAQSEFSGSDGFRSVDSSEPPSMVCRPATTHSFEEDETNLLFVDFQAPFATSCVLTDELEEFYRKCCTAPQLSMCETPADSQHADDVTQEAESALSGGESLLCTHLKRFQLQSPEYDQFVQKLTCTP